MAQVAPKARLQQWINNYLAYLEEEWQGLPEIARDWDRWKEHERLDFVVEWPIREDRLHQLQEWAEQDLLNPQQRARHEELMKVVARNRPILAELLKD